MKTKILHIGEGDKRVSVTLMGDPHTAERIVAALKKEFGDVQVKSK